MLYLPDCQRRCICQRVWGAETNRILTHRLLSHHKIASLQIQANGMVDCVDHWRAARCTHLK